MESRYKMDKLLVDNLIQGQQGKLWPQEKKILHFMVKNQQIFFAICVKPNFMID